MNESFFCCECGVNCGRVGMKDTMNKKIYCPKCGDEELKIQTGKSK